MNVSHFFIEMYQLYYIFIFSIKHIYCCFVSGMHSKFEVNNPSIFESFAGPTFSSIFDNAGNNTASWKAPRLYNNSVCIITAHAPGQHMCPSPGPQADSKCIKTLEVGYSCLKLKACQHEIGTDENQEREKCREHNNMSFYLPSSLSCVGALPHELDHRFVVTTNWLLEQPSLVLQEWLPDDLQGLELGLELELWRRVTSFKGLSAPNFVSQKSLNKLCGVWILFK